MKTLKVFSARLLCVVIGSLRSKRIGNIRLFYKEVNSVIIDIIEENLVLNKAENFKVPCAIINGDGQSLF